MSKTLKNTDKNVPQFFIPATYKTHQKVVKPNDAPSFSEQPKLDQSSTGNLISSQTSHAQPQELSGELVYKSNDIEKPKLPANANLLLPSPGGMLDLSMYSFEPKPTTKQEHAAANGPTLPHMSSEETNKKLKDTEQYEIASLEKEKKRRRFRRPRRNSKVDWLIRLLEDKRVGDDDAGKELEDLQLPRLRRVLNIIFVTLGVSFLLAVIIVIIYTTFATDTEALNEACIHRNKEPELCVSNQSLTTTTGQEVTNVTITEEVSSTRTEPNPINTNNPSGINGLRMTEQPQFPPSRFYRLPDVSGIKPHLDTLLGPNQPESKQRLQEIYRWSPPWYSATDQKSSSKHLDVYRNDIT